LSFTVPHMRGSFFCGRSRIGWGFCYCWVAVSNTLPLNGGPGSRSSNAKRRLSSWAAVDDASFSCSEGFAIIRAKAFCNCCRSNGLTLCTGKTLRVFFSLSRAVVRLFRLLMTSACAVSRAAWWGVVYYLNLLRAANASLVHCASGRWPSGSLV
jgi:hypothetical protein